MLNLNSSPYFDDYDKTKNFHKILFNPAKPVQARELTQIQSILQEQIKRHGDHIFKNGTVVIPGHIFYDDKVKYLKLETIYENTNVETYLDDLVDKQIKGDTNGITALVLHYDIKTATDMTTVYIKYTSAAGTINSFQPGETLTCADIPGLVFAAASVTDNVGSAAICTINDGVYYINGYFVIVEKQIVTISKYDNISSAIVGLDYIETIITENEDDTLYDNAFGFTNYGAPGAHRLNISLNFAVKSYDYTLDETSEVKFIDLLKIKNGVIEYLKDKTEYAEIEKWLARRTYEESGNYTVKKFTSDAYNYRNNDRGNWVTNTPYLIGDIVFNATAGRYYIALNQGHSGPTIPAQTYGIQSDGTIYWNELPSKIGFTNNGKTSITSTSINDHIDADGKMVVVTSPGKAYVKGFEVEFNSPTSSIVPKARVTKQITQGQLYAPAGSYVLVTNLAGMPNVNTNLTKINLLNTAAATIGTAWVRSLEYLSGSLATPSTMIYELFLFGVKMYSGYNFSKDVHKVSSTVFSADISSMLTALSGSSKVVTTSATVDGVGTYFDFELKVGDRVKFVEPLPATGVVWGTVQSITSPTRLVLTATISTAVGSTMYKGTAELIKLGDYIKKLPNIGIDTLRTSAGAIDMTYTVSKYYTFQTAIGVYTHQITLTGGETFLPTGHILILDTGTLSTSVPPTSVTFAIDSPATTLTISGIGDVAATKDYKLLAIVRRTGSFAKEKIKTLATKTLTLTDATSQKYTNTTINLTEADCIRLIKVTESGNPTTKNAYTESGETDITSEFVFSNGQRAEFYDVGTITTNRTNNRPLRITFEYFDHSSGDYFSADSYSTIPGSLIGTNKVEDQLYFLPDCLDFRSRISDDGLNFDTGSATGASISDPILSETTIGTSYSYFLPRTDTLGIDTSGEMSYNVGMEFGDGMKISTINVEPYTENPAIDVTFADTQVMNFTMEDLVSINNRLSDVEYYVALSQVEKDSLDISIKDEFGLERDKNGLLIDGFSNHDVSDYENSDLKTSLETNLGECRALSTMSGVELTEPLSVTDSTRTANNYALTGSILTLPYTEESMIKQTYASNYENVQAYASLNYIGNLIIYPNADAYTSNTYHSVISTRVMTPRTETVEATRAVYKAPVVAVSDTRVTYGPSIVEVTKSPVKIAVQKVVKAAVSAVKSVSNGIKSIAKKWKF